MFLFASLLLLAVIVAILTTSFFKLNELKRVEQTLIAEIEQRGGDVNDIKGKPNQKSDAKSFEQTGYPAHLLKADTQLVSDFFEQAFTWSNDVEYGKAHAFYIEQLGEHNSFVEMYLGKGGDVAIGFRTGDDAGVAGEMDKESFSGKENDIVFTSGTDEKDLEPKILANSTVTTFQSEMDSVEIVPLRMNRDTIHYIAFITYYADEKILLENKAELSPETAIIQFSIVDTENGREIFDVEAWSTTEAEGN